MKSNLTPGQIERLVILSEECAEVIQVASKVLRFGLHDHHPDRPTGSNQLDLEIEIGDLLAAVDMLIAAGDLRSKLISMQRAHKPSKLRQYLFHQ